MDELMIFSNKEFGQVRTITINNEPWFVGKDVAEALKYNEPNKAISRHVLDDDRMFHPVTDTTGKDGQDHAKPHMYWTQKGRLFIYALMKKNGIVPIMERESETE